MLRSSLGPVHVIPRDARTVAVKQPKHSPQVARPRFISPAVAGRSVSEPPGHRTGAGCRWADGYPGTVARLACSAFAHDDIQVDRDSPWYLLTFPLRLSHRSATALRLNPSSTRLHKPCPCPEFSLLVSCCLVPPSRGSKLNAARPGVGVIWSKEEQKSKLGQVAAVEVIPG
jgi:hypothetical protein